jgi:glycosyltransferase involved in cell wall biosynthesis
MTVDVTAIVTCMTDAERPFLQEALESVHSQTLPCETIVVVLESNTWIGGLVAESPHVRVMRRPPGWEGAARHTGIAAATTEFVAFLDGDDVWLPTKTRKQVDLLRDSGGDFAGVDHMLMTEEGRPFAFGLARYIAMPSAWMVRRETMLRYPFDPTLAVGADGEWWRSTWNTVPKFRIPEPLIKYRVRRQSMSNATPSKRRKAALAKLSKLPTARPLLLAATCVLHKAFQRPDYVPLNEWHVSKTKN